jgi:hypothetical protein
LAQLDATANVPGTFAYSPAGGTIFGAGLQTLTVAFTPQDSTDYSSTTATATIIVAPATPTVTVSDGGGVYNGSPFAATASIAGIDGKAGPSLEGVSPTLTYYAGGSATGTSLSGPPTEAGTYTVVAAFPGSGDFASALSAPVTFTIHPADTTVAVVPSSEWSAFGQWLVFSAIASPDGPGAGTPTG